MDFDLFGVLFRALSLSLEALAVGGVMFLWLAATPSWVEQPERATLRTRLCRSSESGWLNENQL